MNTKCLEKMYKTKKEKTSYQKPHNKKKCLNRNKKKMKRKLYNTTISEEETWRMQPLLHHPTTPCHLWFALAFLLTLCHVTLLCLYSKIFLLVECVYIYILSSFYLSIDMYIYYNMLTPTDLNNF